MHLGWSVAEDIAITSQELLSTCAGLTCLFFCGNSPGGSTPCGREVAYPILCNGRLPSPSRNQLDAAASINITNTNNPTTALSHPRRLPLSVVLRNTTLVSRRHISDRAVLLSRCHGESVPDEDSRAALLMVHRVINNPAVLEADPAATIRTRRTRCVILHDMCPLVCISNA